MFFSGFNLINEKELFEEYLEENDFTISGFSYGAIKAVQYTIKSIEKGVRVDKLQLFSPSYFNDKDKKFKRMQLMFFKKDEISYKNNFLQNIQYPNNINLKNYISNGIYDELDILLNYHWDESTMKKIVDSKIKIEVFLGSEDKIINSFEAKEFFRKFGEVYFVKGVGHLLQ